VTARNADAYLKTQVLTASPEKLQLMLYEGAIRFANRAREHLVACDYEASYGMLVKAQKIVLELICGLRPEENRSLCDKMAALYTFVYRRLLEANIYHSTQAIDDALKILTIQRDTWIQLLENLAGQCARETALEVPAGSRG